MGQFRMPSLGADMDVGTIIEWLVKPGDVVRRGQIVAVVDTAKAAIEIESFEDGVVQEILVGPGGQVPVGTPLALFGGAVGAPGRGATGPSPTPATPLAAPERERGAPPPEEVLAAAAPGGRGVPSATPPVRHLAHQLGIDLSGVPGTGPDGHITHDDVLRAAGEHPGAPAAAPTAGASAASRRAGMTSSPDAVRSAARATAPPARPAGEGPGQGRLRATPRARRIAAERGIDLDHVRGTGAHGAVLADDVLAQPSVRRPEVPAGGDASAAAGPASAVAGAPAAARPTGGPAPRSSTLARAPRAARGDGQRKAAMRSAIASLMSRSNAEIPHYHVTQTMDLGPALAWLRGRNLELPAAQRLLPAVLFLRATVLAAVAVPDLNGHWRDGALQPAARVDLGVAVATRGGGLVTPAIPDAADLGIHELMARLADLVARARRGTLRQAEMAGASITVSSLGESGPDALYGVIFPPQVALVGVGGIVERPWAVDGMLTVRPTATVVLAADHRASDGRTASAFLAAFAHALAHPEEL